MIKHILYLPLQIRCPFSLCPWRLDSMNSTNEYLSKLEASLEMRMDISVWFQVAAHDLYKVYQMPTSQPSPPKTSSSRPLHLLLFFISLDLGLATALLWLALGFFFQYHLYFCCNLTYNILERNTLRYLLPATRFLPPRKRGVFYLMGNQEHIPCSVFNYSFSILDFMFPIKL